MTYHINTGLYAALVPLVSPTVAVILYAACMLVTIAAAYLLGSVNSAIIVSKHLFGDDIRRHGSGNAGLTNMLRTYGGKAAVLTLIGDMLKAVLSIVIAGLLFGFCYVRGISVSDGTFLAALFAAIGHIFPVYYKFKGGKGVLVTATAALVLSPIPFAILFLCFALVLTLTHYVSLSSVTVGVLYPVALYTYMKICFPAVPMPGLMSLSAITLAILIVYCHRENLKRIGNRTERTFSFRKKPTYKNENADGGDSDSHGA